MTRPVKHRMGEPRRGKPDWLRIAPRTGEGYFQMRSLISEHGLNTICDEAACPNRAECWNAKTATFLILGGECTRRCTFCNVGYGWSGRVDTDEPRRVAEAVARLELRHAVITSVDRDDLDDGGASIFVETVERIRAQSPHTEIELLIPDFADAPHGLDAVLDSAPEVLAHNLETVPRLYRGVRPRSDYHRSLDVLGRAVAHDAVRVVKTGIMVGLGEEFDEVEHLMQDVHARGVDILTIGQYLQPTAKHHRVERFWEPAEFDALATRGREIGLGWVESGPLVRSSYHAANQTAAFR